MRDDPGMDNDRLATCLARAYGIRVVSITFLPIGYDLSASVYEVVTAERASYFLKVRSGPVHEPGLLVSRALVGAGVANVLAPLPTRTSALWCSLDDPGGSHAVLYPFVRGENAMIAGLSNDQWREFGASLRAVHGSGLDERFRDLLPVETFALPSAPLVRRLLALVAGTEFESEAASWFAAFWRANAGRIRDLLARAEQLGRGLQSKSFELVLCHGDIHAANILVGDDGRIWLVDWDEPLIAPRERDLLFVVGSTIARPVEPEEEDLFFEGYGPADVDPAALAYYRYERIVQDLGETGQSVFLDPGLSEQVREEGATLAIDFFMPGGALDRAETVTRARWPNAPA